MKVLIRSASVFTLVESEHNKLSPLLATDQRGCDRIKKQALELFRNMMGGKALRYNWQETDYECVIYLSNIETGYVQLIP